MSAVELIEKGLQELRAKQAAWPTRERALAITNIEQGLMWLRELEARDEARGWQQVPG